MWLSPRVADRPDRDAQVYSVGSSLSETELMQ